MHNHGDICESRGDVERPIRMAANAMKPSETGQSEDRVSHFSDLAAEWEKTASNPLGLLCSERRRLARLNEATKFESPIPLERPPQFLKRRKRDRDREEGIPLAGSPKPSLREQSCTFAREMATVRTCDFIDIGIPRHYLA